MKQEMIDLLYTHMGKVIGIVAGIFVGIIFLLVGFWKTLFFVIIVAIGYYVGTRVDNNENIRDVIERFLPDHWR